MLQTPWIASLLFLILTILAIAIFFRYADMSYCKYICPIGAVTKSYGKIGMTRLDTYQEACSECKTFDCASACPLGLQPFLFEKRNSMRDCTLCMDCAQVCEAVSFSVVKPASALTGKIKDSDNVHSWVYILLFAVITITMQLHHGLGHSSLKTSLPWYRSGEWLATFMPSAVDWVGFSAVVVSLGLTFGFIFGGFKVASIILKIPFKEFLHQNSYALAPMMIIGALSHVGTFFFVHYYSELVNAWLWLISSKEVVSPLASMRDGWVHSFSIFAFIGAFWSATLLYKRIALYGAPLKERLLSWAVSGTIIWFYLFLLLLRMSIH
jgi:ferredoxin